MRSKAEKPIVVRETKEICILSNCRWKVGGCVWKGVWQEWKVRSWGRRGRRWRTKEKKKTKGGWIGMRAMKGKRKRPASKEKSEKVWSNSRACCYLNPSRTAWVVRGWRGILSSSRCDENIRRITFDNDPCDGIFVWRQQLLRDDGFV